MARDYERSSDFIKALEARAQNGDPEAGRILSLIAGLGCSGQAREIVTELDKNPPNYPPMVGQKIRRDANEGYFRNVVFCITHPLRGLWAKRRQVLVALELQAPPPTSTFEKFPELSIKKADSVLEEARKGR